MTLQNRIEEFHAKYDDSIQFIVEAMNQADLKDSYQRSERISWDDEERDTYDHILARSTPLKSLSSFLDIIEPRGTDILCQYSHQGGRWGKQLKVSFGKNKNVTVADENGGSQSILDFIEHISHSPLRALALKITEKPVDDISESEKQVVLAERKLEQVLGEWKEGDYLETLLADVHSYRQKHAKSYETQIKQEEEKRQLAYEQERQKEELKRQTEKERSALQERARLNSYAKQILGDKNSNDRGRGSS